MEISPDVRPNLQPLWATENIIKKNKYPRTN